MVLSVHGHVIWFSALLMVYPCQISDINKCKSGHKHLEHRQDYKLLFSLDVLSLGTDNRFIIN